MTDTSPEQQVSSAQATSGASEGRNFLVLVDDSKELERALYYACRRARRVDGRVILLHCKETGQQENIMQFLGIGERLQEETREAAEQLLYDLSEKAYQWSKKHAVVLIEDDLSEALPRLLEKEGISIIISPMPSKNSSSGSWAAYLLKEGAEAMHIPITMVPATMTIDEINKLT